MALGSSEKSRSLAQIKKLLSFDNWTLTGQIMAGPFVLFMVLTTAIVTSLIVLPRLIETSNQINRSYTILREMGTVTKLILDMETGVRGFGLAQDEQFLEPFILAKEEIFPSLANLSQLVGDNAAQGARIARITELVSSWQTFFAEPIIAQVRAGLDVTAFAQQGEGKKRTDAIRDEIAAFEAHEVEIQQARLQADAAIKAWATRVIYLELILALAALYLAYRTGQRIVWSAQVLAQAAAQITQGNLDTEVPVNGRNELASAGQAFNIMAHSLAIAHDEMAAQTLAAQTQAIKVERARSELSAVLDSTSEAILLFSPNDKLQIANLRTAEMFAVNLDDIVGCSFDQLYPILVSRFDNFDEILNRFNTESDTHAQITETLAQIYPVQREIALFSAPVTGHDGQYLGRLYVLRDVTHEREVDRMKSEFVSLVSHELRTPLTSIKGYTEFMLDGEAGEISDDQAAYLHIIQGNTDRLVSLISNLLDISQIESGKIELRCTMVELKDVIHNCADLLRPQLESKNQALAIDLPDKLPTVTADADRIMQVLTNLLSNAHKYTPAGGGIYLRAGYDNSSVQIAVQDTGIGLSPAEQAELFTKFYRARNRATQEEDGTGLGLAITRSLVEMHGGCISVESAPGQGATFRFTLPLGDTAPIFAQEFKERI